MTVPTQAIDVLNIDDIEKSSEINYRTYSF